jgi:hypothetical protein
VLVIWYVTITLEEGALDCKLGDMSVSGHEQITTHPFSDGEGNKDDAASDGDDDDELQRQKSAYLYT